MKTILVPTDFSATGNNALKYAVQFAQQSKSKLILYHSYFIPVFDISTLADKNFRETDAALKERIFKQLHKTHDKICRDLKISKNKLKTDFRVSRNMMSSFVTEDILQCAKETKADLIIMGTHGATGLKKFFFGSNTADVLIHSKIPVLAIPGKYRFREIKNIVYASDFEQTETELKTIVPFARSLNAEIELLHMEYFTDGAVTEEQFKKLMKKTGYSKMKLVHKKIAIDLPLIKYLKKYMAAKSNGMLAMFATDKKFLNRVFLLSSKVEDMSYNLNRPLFAIRKSVV